MPRYSWRRPCPSCCLQGSHFSHSGFFSRVQPRGAVETIKLAAQVHLPGTADSVCRAAARAVFPRMVSPSQVPIFSAPHEDDRQPDCPTVSSCSLCRTEIIAIVSSQPLKYYTDSCIQKGDFRRCWNSQPPSDSVRDMRSSDIICPQCNAGYRRIEVASSRRTKGEYRCLLCDHVLEAFDGSTEVGIRLTVQPEKTAK